MFVLRYLRVIGLIVIINWKFDMFIIKKGIVVFIVLVV